MYDEVGVVKHNFTGGRVFGFSLPRGSSFWSCSALPTKARVPIVRWDRVPSAMYSIRRADHDYLFKLPRHNEGGRAPNH